MGGASDGDRGRTLKCPKPGCDGQVYDLIFISEEALVSDKGFVRKPKAVSRNRWASCPVHGKVWLASPGHHITSSETVGYVADKPWQEDAFAVMNIDRKF